MKRVALTMGLLLFVADANAGVIGDENLERADGRWAVRDDLERIYADRGAVATKANAFDPAAASSRGCAMSPRDLRAHDARRGEALLSGLTMLVVGGRMLRRRVIDRRSMI